MELREGYKKTEVGVIPEDWNTPTIGTVCRLINGRGFKPYEWKSEGLPIIRIQNLNGSDEFNYYQGSYDKKIEVEDGQLVFAWSGSRGTSFGPHVWNGSLGLLNYHTWKMVVKENEVEADFFLHALKQLTKFIEEKAHGASALVHTQKWEMEGFKFPLPPTKTEQTAIANALSDADAWIQSLTRLIVKKRQIKQGAMQTLLNPYENGHLKGGWVVKTVDEIAEVKSGKRLPKGKLLLHKETDHPYIRVTDMYFGGVHLNEIMYIPDETYSAIKNYRIFKKDIFISVAGTLGIVGKIPDELDGANLTENANRFTNIQCDQEYLLFVLSSPLIQDIIDSEKTLGAQPKLALMRIRNFKIPLPIDKTEQTRIATILTDIDNEITSLETKLTKAKTIKQGMMQNLLTGRIRLI